MLMFRCGGGLDRFLDATNFVHSRSKFYNTVHFKCSPAMFSVIVSRRSPRCIIELQLMPQFFNLFFSNWFWHSTVSITDFYNTLFHMKRIRFSLMIFCLREFLDCLKLTFLNPSGGDPFEAYLPLLLSLEEEDVGTIDYETFVSIDSREFLRILIMLNASHVSVTITNSLVKFAETRREYILTKEDSPCIIGGVAPGEEIQFVIILNPIESFYSLIYWSDAERVWLFKSPKDNSHGIIIVPVGLYSQYLVHSTGTS